MASDIFAKIGDIKGESLDAKHKGSLVECRGARRAV
jgi:type VI protein secretion system component Hcp